jgi:cobalt-precorrin-5B (C1)-methyltransferase
VCADAAKRICANLQRRSGDQIKLECVMFSKELGELAKSEGAEEYIKRLATE